MKQSLKYIIEGFASLTLFPPPLKLEELFPYYSANTPQQRDAQALAEDWRKIGQDLQKAIGRYI